MAVKEQIAVSVHLDDSGIPVSDYGANNGAVQGKQRSIVAIADKGLDYWNRLNPHRPQVLLSYSWDTDRDLRTAQGLKHPVSPEEGLLNCARWIFDNATHRNGHAVWQYAYPSYYGTQAGWRCAHAQGQAIQLLLRAYDTNSDERYLETAAAAVRGYGVAVEDGGIAEHLGTEQSWYHKFADESAQRPAVLNGMMFSLLGLLDYRQRVGGPEVEELLDHGVNALIATLPQYDSGDWSAYDLFRLATSKHYHHIHCIQLSAIAAYRPDSKILEVLDRWSQADVSNATGGRYEKGSAPLDARSSFGPAKL